MWTLNDCTNRPLVQVQHYAMHYGLLKLNVPGVLHQPILGLTKIKRKRLSPRSSWLYKDGNISCHLCSPSEHSSNPSTSPFLLIEEYSDSCSHWGSTFPTLHHTTVTEDIFPSLAQSTSSFAEPFFLLILIIINNHQNKNKKLSKIRSWFCQRCKYLFSDSGIMER